MSDQSSMQPADEIASQTHVSRRDLAVAQTPEHPLLARRRRGWKSRAGLLYRADRTSKAQLPASFRFTQRPGRHFGERRSMSSI
jgi:hypothetical protein